MTGTRQAAAADPEIPAAADRRGARPWLAALAGLVAAAAGLGVGELVAAFVSPQSSPVVAVGSAAITLTPEPVKQSAIRTFGTHDKTALLVGIVVLLGLYALLVGVLALRSRRVGAAGILLFGLIGIVAAVTRPAAGTADGFPSFIGALAGVVVLLALVRFLSLPAQPDRLLLVGGMAVQPDRRGIVQPHQVLGRGIAVFAVRPVVRRMPRNEECERPFGVVFNELRRLLRLTV